MADSGELRGVAFSYVRFSAKEQERGDSLRRQTDLRDKWLARHPSITLDTSLTLEDLGVSAFRGRNRLDDAHALGQFVRAVENGRVARGSLLLIENLDRLSREQEEDALELFLKLLKAGIVIVQLQPETVFRKGDGMFGLMRAIMELGRGHAESARKSERVTAAWDERKRKAAAGGIVTARCPAWLEVEGGRFKVRPGAAALIRRLFALCKAGHGCRAIAAALNKEGVPGWGKGPWEEAYIRKIIQGRAVLGEFRPMKGRGGRGGKRVADAAAPVVPNYYPAIVTEADWDAAAAARKSRDNRGGRPAKHGEHVHVFQGLLYDARTGGTFQVAGRMDQDRMYRVLTNAGYKRHGLPCVAFPLAAFERAVLALLREVKPADIMPAGDGAGDEVLELSGRLAGIEAKQAALQAAIEEADAGAVAALVKTVAKLDSDRKAAAEALAAARQKAASPLSEAWGEFGGLVKALWAAPDQREARVRLRAVLARVVESVWVYLTGRGEDKLAAVWVNFAGGKHRPYWVMSRPARWNGKARRPARWWATSQPARLGGYFAGPLPADEAERLTAELLAYDPPGWPAAGAEPGAWTWTGTNDGHEVERWTYEAEPAPPERHELAGTPDHYGRDATADELAAMTPARRAAAEARIAAKAAKKPAAKPAPAPKAKARR